VLGYLRRETLRVGNACALRLRGSTQPTDLYIIKSSSLNLLDRPVSCSHREAAELFYSDRERGSDRSAGMMLDKLAALGLIRKQFDGNISRIEILAVAAELEPEKTAAVEITIEPFDPRCDAIPVANRSRLYRSLSSTFLGRYSKNSHRNASRFSEFMRSLYDDYSSHLRAASYRVRFSEYESRSTVISILDVFTSRSISKSKY
jgi:hypothetical protein